jgi:ubiquinone/menaquinone biosynthesis C-methylase UbiE
MSVAANEIQYVLGHSDGELHRLTQQADDYRPLTGGVLRAAGIWRGARVLDLGCGPGDVTLAAADLVGPAGHVVGVDCSAPALDLARRRAFVGGYSNVSFELAEIDAYRPPHRLDAVVGRQVLMYQADPAATLARMRAWMAPGAVVCMQEMDMTVARSVPMAPLLATCKEWIIEAFRRSGALVDQGSTLHRVFRRAGLPAPELSVGQLVDADGAPVICRMVVGVLASLLPRICEFGIATEAEVGLATLEQRLREQLLALDAVAYSPLLVGAIARLPHQ